MLSITKICTVVIFIIFTTACLPAPRPATAPDIIAKASVEMEPHFTCVHYFSIAGNEDRSIVAIDDAVTLGEQRQMHSSEIMKIYNGIREEQLLKIEAMAMKMAIENRPAITGFDGNPLPIKPIKKEREAAMLDLYADSCEPLKPLAAGS